MPLSVAEGAVMGAGMLFATGATLAYKRKQTKLFKVMTGGLLPCSRRRLRGRAARTAR